MTRSSARRAQKPKASAGPRPAAVFRDFVRQLEKLDAPQPPKGAAR